MGRHQDGTRKSPCPRWYGLGAALPAAVRTFSLAGDTLSCLRSGSPTGSPVGQYRDPSQGHPHALSCRTGEPGLRPALHIGMHNPPRATCRPGYGSIFYVWPLTQCRKGVFPITRLAPAFTTTAVKILWFAFKFVACADSIIYYTEVKKFGPFWAILGI